MKFLILWCLLLGLGNSLAQDRKGPAASLEESWAEQVVRIRIGASSLTEKKNLKALDVILDRIESRKAKAVIFDLDSPGGMAFPTQKLMDRISGLTRPTLSFVNDSAVGAACLIAFSTDRIYMAPDSLIGKAAVVSGSETEIDGKMQAKLEKRLQDHLRKVADRKGHDLEAMKALMFTSKEEKQVGDIVVKPGQHLMLSAREATRKIEGSSLLARAEVADLAALLKLENLADERVVTIHLGESGTPTENPSAE